VYLTQSKEYEPRIEEIYCKTIELDGQTIRVEIQDLAGHEEYPLVRDRYYENADGILLIYSIAASSTVDDVLGIHERIERVKNADSSDIPMILIGNKSDLNDDRVITHQKGKQLAKEYKIRSFMETSAKTGTNVEEVFHQIVRQCIQKKNNTFNPIHSTNKKCDVM
jgi:small GTP-binding protein